MRAHYLQHVPFEGLGSIEPWLVENGFTVNATRLFAGEKLPAAEGVDFLIVMGGPMSVNDEQQHPWLVAEKNFIGEMVAMGRPVLGICLGAQLIASAMGAPVYQNPRKEIGWFPVRGFSPGDNNVFSFPPSTTVFHWHGETFDLPSGATLLAESDACRNQAFQIGPSVIGLQFHLETTRQSAEAMIENCASELVPAPYVQSSEEILVASPERYRAINALMADILSYLSPR
ncbi:MAG: type 1 glutamine amidotransferase [Geoalkalibacter sp.]|jgi:GMP synthase-like glutamine amidotransferase|uniref:type 1 glutamine amidotransferase n=1 Tax=Geoalkalibacter sp. TaxID=3041440 RepID=UPI002A9D7063|nr:gamma-glutamyl-gamma-aminobutyrate hydrolase family protein [Thermodesulfobacteriota bacterium]